MSFLGLDFDNVFEPKSAKEGEYQVRVLDANIKDSQKTGGQYIALKLEVLGDPEIKDINHVMMIPTAKDDLKQKNKRLSAIQAALKAFGFDPSALSNVQDLIGATGWAILIEEADPEYGMQNRVRRFVSGK